MTRACQPAGHLHQNGAESASTATYKSNASLSVAQEGMMRSARASQAQTEHKSNITPGAETQFGHNEHSWSILATHQSGAPETYFGDASTFTFASLFRAAFSLNGSKGVQAMDRQTQAAISLNEIRIKLQERLHLWRTP